MNGFNRGRRPHAVVLGGGIRGTAIAALLAQSAEFEVTLLERHRIASGTTSTNHGRLHSGAGLWRANMIPLAGRHRLGGDTMRQFLSGHSILRGPALYAIADPRDVRPFQAACSDLRIDCRQLTEMEAASVSGLWCRQPSAIVELPESSFSPAEVAGRLALRSLALGARIVLGVEAASIELTTSSDLVVGIRGRPSISADIVINALGNWSNTLSSSLPIPRIDLNWYRWKLLCTRSPLSRSLAHSVLASIEPTNIAPTVILHQDWAVFGCRQAPTAVASPGVPEQDALHPFDAGSQLDREMLELLYQHFAVPFDRGSLCTISGVHPALPTTYPNQGVDVNETGFRMLSSDEVPGYYVVYGENATVALLDAMDTVNVVMAAHLPAARQRQTPIAQLHADLCVPLTEDPVSDIRRDMVWKARVS
jgi:glycine/D-amino acid oxidase-like deaminating enzyme